MLGLVTANSALAQAPGQRSQACFEVLAARPNVEPSVSIMVDKCSGRSWVLTRSGKNFRWILIATEPEKPKFADRAPMADSAVAPGKMRQNCFTFNDRKFCE